MPSKPLTKLWPISLLAIAGCATSGQPAKPLMPQCHLPPVDSALMEKTDYVKQVSDEFFVPLDSAKPSVTPSKKP